MLTKFFKKGYSYELKRVRI